MEIKELDPIPPMTAEQAETLKRLAEAAYEREAFKPNLTRAEADVPAWRAAAYTLRTLSDVTSFPRALVRRRKRTPPQGELGGVESRVKNKRMLVSVTFSSMPLL
jgi:hypothetical protein